MDTHDEFKDEEATDFKEDPTETADVQALLGSDAFRELAHATSAAAACAAEVAEPDASQPAASTQLPRRAPLFPSESASSVLSRAREELGAGLAELAAPPSEPSSTAAAASAAAPHATFSTGAAARLQASLGGGAPHASGSSGVAEIVARVSGPLPEVTGGAGAADVAALSRALALQRLAELGLLGELEEGADAGGDMQAQLAALLGPNTS